MFEGFCFDVTFFDLESNSFIVVIISQMTIADKSPAKPRGHNGTSIPASVKEMADEKICMERSARGMAATILAAILMLRVACIADL